MKTQHFNARIFTRCCVCAVGLPLLCVRAEGGDTQNNQNTFAGLRERTDAAIRMAETNENARRYPDVRSDIFTYAVRQVNAMGKLGDRAALPFLEEKSLITNAPSSFRSRAALTYVNLATAEECATFLPKIFAIGNEKKGAGGWRNKVTPAGLAKIDAAIAKHELSDETVARFMTALLMFAQSTDNSWEVKNADDFLAKHCEDYPTSKQRVALWHTVVTTGNEWSKENYAPLSGCLEAIPPRKRVDLRKRFPNLPPLAEDKDAEKTLKVALAIGAAFVAVCVAIWIMAMRRKTPTR